MGIVFCFVLMVFVLILGIFVLCALLALSLIALPHINVPLCSYVSCSNSVLLRDLIIITHFCVIYTKPHTQISATVDPSMPSAVSTPDLDMQLSNAANAKKTKSKRFSPSMKLRNLKGRSTPDIKTDDNHKLDAGLGQSASPVTPVAPEAVAAEATAATAGNEMAVGGGSTIQEFSIVEQCIKQFEEFYHIYLSRNVLNIQNAAPRTPAECSVVVQLIGETPSLPSTPRSVASTPVADGVAAVIDATVSAFEAVNIDEIVRDSCPARRGAINAMFETLRLKDVSRAQRLHALLHKTLTVSSAEGSEASSSSTSSEPASPPTERDPAAAAATCDERTEKSIYRLMNLRLSESVRQSVRLASSLLVEMSTFPNYTQTLLTDACTDVPAWLQVLSLVGCYGRCDRELQLSAIATLFDLITLIRSQMEHSSNPGVTFVVMIPLLQYGHVYYLEQRTRVLQVIASTLWDLLGNAASDPAQIAALLYQVNGSVRSGLVETVIGHRIANTHDQWSESEYRLENQHHHHRHQRQRLQPNEPAVDRLTNYRAERLSDVRIMCTPPTHTRFDCDALLGDSESQRFRKFELLWEFGRDNQNASSAGFEKTLLMVFDQLSLPYHLSIRTLVSKWLQESLLSGDMHRLVCPLMRILFAAGTKRVSVKHAHLMRREAAAAERFGGADGAADGDETDGEISGGDKDVYAISSEDGNVKYHHHSMDVFPREKKRSPIRKFFGVTIGGSAKNKAAQSYEKNAADALSVSTLTTATTAAVPVSTSAAAASASNTANNNNNISLIVNPLDSSSDIDAWESETASPVGSAPTTTTTTKTDAHAIDESLQSQPSVSLKEDEYYSSCEEETDESYSETDSETRGCDTDNANATQTNSLSSVATAHVVDMKRFAGDCERVTEMLSQHDRTKNRKQYQVTTTTTTKAAGRDQHAHQQQQHHHQLHSVADIAEGMELCPEASTPAGEFFSSASLNGTGVIETFVIGDELIDAAGATTTATTTPAAAADVGDSAASEQGSSSFIRPAKQRRIRQSSESSQNASVAAGGKSIQRDVSNRLSSASKTSSDSNRSRRSDRPASSRRSQHQQLQQQAAEQCVFESINNNHTNGDAIVGDGAAAAGAGAAQTPGTGSDNNFDSVDSGVGLTSTTTTTTTTAQQNATEASKDTPISWNRAQDAANEHGKKNADILRKTAAAAAASAAATSAASAADTSSSFLRRTNLTLSDRKPHFDRLHPFHTHMLLYYGVYDTKQVLYALQTLRNMIACDCRTFLYFSMTTSVPTVPLRQLLVRHRKSIFGKGFSGSILNTEFSQAYRGCMYLDVLFTVCLYYARSFFQREAAEMNRLPGSEDIGGNCKIQLASVELLTLLCTELIAIVKDMGKQLACYIYDLLAKCKLQKIILHCILSCVHSFQPKIDLTFTEQILAFNELSDERLHAESLQIQLLRLLSSVIKLEYEVTALKGDDVPIAGSRSPNAASAGGGSAANTPHGNGPNSSISGSSSNNSSTHSHSSGANAATGAAAAAAGAANDGSPTRLGPSTPTNVKYLPNCPISQQPMFLSAVLKALQSEQLRPLHSKWNDLITSSLNCFTFGSLTNIVISVIHQLCANVDVISRVAAAKTNEASAPAATATAATPFVHIPPDYVVAQLHAITVLCHYCLLDSMQPTSLTHRLHQAAAPQAHNSGNSFGSGGGSGSGHSTGSGSGSGATGGGNSSTANTGQLLHNIVHAILSPPPYTEQQQSRNAQLLAARNAVLSHLPVIVASVARMWDTNLGQSRTVRQQIVEFLSPVFRQHGQNFLAAVSVTWQERGTLQLQKEKDATPAVEEPPSRKDSLTAEASASRALPQACAAQLSLVKLVSSIRVMSMDTFVQTLHQVVKSPPNIHHPPIGLSIECSALELFYFYMRQTPPMQLADCWASLLLLLRDGIALMPPAQFVILAVLNEFVLRSPQMPFTDRKDLRDLHDVTARLVEALSNVAGARLEQTTWLRRNLAVKEDLPHVSSAVDGNNYRVQQLLAVGVYSVQAQTVMAAVLANLLDVAYGYQDKDKVVTIITTLMYNITPYLKNHTVRNVPSFYACSQLLASLSGFQVSNWT